MIPASAPETAPSTWLARAAVGTSIAVHMAAVAFFLGYAGAGTYESTPEAVPVSVVTPEEAAQETPPPPEQRLDLRPSLDNTKSPTPAPEAQPDQAQKQPQQDTALKQKMAAAPSATPQPAPVPKPSYTTPPPDISLQYGVDLGLKELSMAAAAETPRDGKSDFDEAANDKAKIDTASIVAFRAQLRNCAPLPAQVSPDDKVVIVMRATFTKDARLAGTPTLIEASASPKGPYLMKAAMSALEKCQPHNALPPDKYAEWRVLDLRFTPQDFRRG